MRPSLTKDVGCLGRTRSRRPLKQTPRRARPTWKRRGVRDCQRVCARTTQPMRHVPNEHDTRSCARESTAGLHGTWACRSTAFRNRTRSDHRVGLPRIGATERPDSFTASELRLSIAADRPNLRRRGPGKLAEPGDVRLERDVVAPDARWVDSRPSVTRSTWRCSCTLRLRLASSGRFAVTFG